jgi:hypothetical protein
LFELFLQDFLVKPVGAGQPGSVFTPELGSAVFVLDVDVFAAFGFDEVVGAAAGDGDKIGLVVAQVGGGVGVGNSEPSMNWWISSRWGTATVNRSACVRRVVSKACSFERVR